ncbi:MAG: serine/threonine protein kinase, partial [Deltaproteobacteria bacterium]|nr:serine/threonine protein kinase [Deltaproteobacteria bacterium]
RRLGIGGMAEVFLAEQQGAAGFKKACVVKRMLSHLALQPRYVEMFMREARLASQLQHANIVQIWDLGEVDGQYFIAMEYIDGLPLNLLARTAWRAGRPVPMEVVCCALADAAEGLAVAHERIGADGKPSPIVPRAISPDNLMIDRDGVTKILDFGIARTADSERTQIGELKGKVPFMPLEQLRGEVVDARADIYALGVTAYWLLTGKRPFTAVSDLALIEVILKETPKPPIELNAHIPPELNELVLRMLAKERDERVSTAREVAAALEHVTAARKAVVVPFVRKVLDDPDRQEDSGPVPAAPGFLPSTPHTDTISGGWRMRSLPDGVRTALVSRAPVASMPSGPMLAAPGTSPTAALQTVEAPRRKTALWAAGGVALVVALLLVALWPGRPEEALAPPPIAPMAPIAQIAPAPAPAPIVPGPPAADPGLAPSSPAPGVDDPAPTPEPTPPVPPLEKAPDKPKRTVTVKGPAEVQWLFEGKVLATGSGVLKVPASAKALVALDKKRGARTTVSIGNGTLDYGTLPKGKLQPRAKPFAEVFLGSVSLGTTPFAAVEVVAGSYKLTFVYKGETRTQSLVVAPGAVVRPVIDFTQR